MLWGAVDEWTLDKAEEFTTIPAETLHELAVTCATETPTSFYHCMGIDHWDNGQPLHLAESALACVTGNVGRPGSQLGFKWYFAENLDFPRWLMPDGTQRAPSTPMTCSRWPTRARSKKSLMPSRRCTYPVVILGAFCDRNQWLDKVLPMLDFIVTVDIYNSDTVEYSDLVLPAAHWFERQDLQFGNNHPFIMWGDKAVEPLGESKLGHRDSQDVGRPPRHQGVLPRLRR